LDNKEANLGILINEGVNIKEVEIVTRELFWVVEFNMYPTQKRIGFKDWSKNSRTFVKL